MAQLNIGFTLEAYADIDQAFYSYAGLAEGRVAARFLRNIDEGLERISSFPHSCPMDLDGIRRLLLRRFPYWVYYRVLPDAIEVMAVLHTKRDTSQIDWDAE